MKKGYKMTQLHKDNIGKSNKGKKRPDRIELNKSIEMRQKVSQSWNDPEIKEKRLKNHKGNKWGIHDFESRKKIREARKKQDLLAGHTPHWKGGVSMSYKKKHAPRPKPEHCEVCGRSGKIMFDHDHKTGKFRGWICFGCNSALGFIGDNTETLKSLINYLENNMTP